MSCQEKNVLVKAPWSRRRARGRVVILEMFGLFPIGKVVRWKMFGEKRENHLEVDGEQGEEGTKGSKEKEVKGLGNVHLILDDLDCAPESLGRISLCPFPFNFAWICRSHVCQFATVWTWRVVGLHWQYSLSHHLNHHPFIMKALATCISFLITWIAPQKPWIEGHHAYFL